MWYGSFMDDDTYFRKANFPIHWAGQTKDGIFVCGACPTPQECLDSNCSRADSDAWQQSDEYWRKLVG